MLIFGEEVSAGEKKYGKALIGHLAHRGEISIPYIAVIGEMQGPILWINGGVHGDELNGSQAAYEYLSTMDTRNLKGAVICTPIANPAAYVDRDKISKLDYLDMDTTFPGNPKGMLSQRQAFIIYKEVKKNANYILSFHTLNSFYEAQPYTIWKRIKGVDERLTEQAREMAMAFGVRNNCFVDLNSAEGELPGVTSGGLDVTAMKEGIVSIMAEMGNGGILDRKMIDCAKRGINNVLVHIGMVEGSIMKDPEQFVVTKRHYVWADEGGLYTSDVKAGQFLHAGDKFGETHFFGDKIDEHHIEEDCLVIATRTNPVVNTGDRLCLIGTEWYKV